MLIGALIIMQLPVSEADAASSASDFKMEGSTLVKYRGTDTNVSVPNTVEVIGESAFEENDTVELIVLPNSVKRIEAYAFWGCDRLDTVVLGKGLKEVGDYAFTNCKGLKDMSVPGNVQTIGIQAFADCVNLTDITIPPETTSIHETAFDGCAKLKIHCETGSAADKYAAEFMEKQKEMPEYEDVPNYGGSDEEDSGDGDSGREDSGYEDSGDEAPGYGNKTGDGVTGGTEGTEEVPSQDAVTDAGNVLGSTQIVGNRAVVFIDNTSPAVLDGNERPSEEAPRQVTAGEMQETENGSIPKYTIVDGRIVADQAYYKKQDLTQVTLPQGIEEIGQFAFARSTVSDIVIPEGVTDIDYGAFYHCDLLKQAVLPSSVENVEPKAFMHTLWVEDFLQNGTEDFLISGKVLIAYRGQEEEAVVPDGVQVIAGEVFTGNTKLGSVVLPESLRVIGEGAFEGCSNLTKVQMGTQVAQIRDRAFAGCPVEKLELPASLQEVGLQAFDGRTEVRYGGTQTPLATHETSAERLSNEKYRNGAQEESDSAAAVAVTGMEPAAAYLEGADRSYTLSVSAVEGDQKAPMQSAYQRIGRITLPESILIYDLQLTDDSGIPVTKLGKQVLTVTLPLPESLAGENVRAVTLDRNGQLENVKSRRVSLDGTDAVSFETTHLSLFGIYGDGTVYDSEAAGEMTVNIQNMSAGPAGNAEDVNAKDTGSAGGSLRNGWNVLKWGLAGTLLLCGAANLFRKKGK